MAALVRPSSATLAFLYCNFILLVALCTFNFTVLGNVLPVNIGYGLLLIVVSSVGTLLGLTAQDVEETLLRSFLLCISVLWTAVGIYHVVEGVVVTGTTDSEALWAGYSSYLLIFIFFIFGSLHHRSKFTAVISLGYSLACIFEICSLWRPLRASVGSYYLLMAALILYYIVAIVLKKFRDGEPSFASIVRNRAISYDYVPLGHAMNTVAFAIFAGHVTGVYPSAAQGFSWVLTAGSYQLLAAVVAVRRSDTYNGFYFFLHSMFWLSNGYNLCIEYVTGRPAPPFVSVTVIFFIMFFFVALAALFREIYQFLQNIALCILNVAILVDGSSGPFVGAMGWILLVISLYGLAAHVSRIQDSSLKLPLGMRCLEGARFRKFLEDSCKCCLSCLYGKHRERPRGGSNRALFSEDFILGYSKYFDLDAVGFASNALVILSILWMPEGLWVLPWAIVVGGVTQYIVGSVSFARGLTMESCSFFTFGSLWLIWGTARSLGVLVQDNGPAAIVGCIAFLCVGLLLFILSLTITKVWTVLIVAFMLVVLGFMLRTLAVPSVFVYENVIGIIFAIVCLYCFLSTVLKYVIGRDVLPFGRPILQVSYLHSQGNRALWADARRATGVKAIADIMNRGGICGIPTDVVYVLVAAVKFPHAVERAYNTKKDAEDRPMSMWISRVEQLAEGRPLFGELVWAFMNEIWPSTVSLVIPKGEWLENLGIGHANNLIGRPDSIAVRMPDNCVTSYLIDQTGPVATTSANPTGEADTTHHLQVLAKLGMKDVDGILCSGPAPENIASTVVDTRRMNQGQLSFFRIGVVPRAHVEALFERIKSCFDENGATTIPSTVTNNTTTPADRGHVNAAFVSDSGEDGNSDDSGLSGENSAGADEDSASYGNDVVPLVTTSQDPELPDSESPNQISGHDNLVYENTSDEEADVVPSLDRRRSAPVSRTSSTRSADGPDADSPYELVLARPGTPVQSIGSRESNLEPQFRLNPLYNGIPRE